MFFLTLFILIFKFSKLQFHFSSSRHNISRNKKLERVISLRNCSAFFVTQRTDADKERILNGFLKNNEHISKERVYSARTLTQVTHLCIHI